MVAFGPTAASCLAERETAKHLVQQQQAMNKKRTRMHRKLFWFWVQGELWVAHLIPFWQVNGPKINTHLIKSSTGCPSHPDHIFEEFKTEGKEVSSRR